MEQPSNFRPKAKESDTRYPHFCPFRRRFIEIDELWFKMMKLVFKMVI